MELEVVSRAQGKIGEDLEVAHAVGAELQVAGWDGVVSAVALQGLEVGRLDCSGKTNVGELGFDFWREGLGGLVSLLCDGCGGRGYLRLLATWYHAETAGIILGVVLLHILASANKKAPPLLHCLNAVEIK